ARAILRDPRGILLLRSWRDVEPTALAREDAGLYDAERVEPVGERRREHADPVGAAAGEIDRRRVGGVARRARDLADAEAEAQRLGDDLIVEHEVVGVLVER